MEEADRARAEARAAHNRRLAYIRQHVPTVFAGLCADRIEWESWDIQLAKAIEIAGWFYDETEAPTDG